jgi:hypothetical protein
MTGSREGVLLVARFVDGFRCTAEVVRQADPLSGRVIAYLLRREVHHVEADSLARSVHGAGGNDWL